jgi:hypothetical protein
MITFYETEDRYTISFRPEDLETVKMMLARSLNTWQPNPPQDLLRVQRQIEALNG